ncbi:hypothetical protein [Maricaulis sp.]|uniref:dienelactone hydrolase family protein n=1 Tax=Maricaulis sp. TaxID=1486257 RepID=UPI002B27AE52|nr:hypothetical protein [Maricaulis sp.]
MRSASHVRLAALALAIATATTLALAGSARAVQADAFDMSDFVRLVPTDARAPKGTVYILPGSSGFDIFGDTGHYRRAAREWVRRCYDVVMVDYRAAYIAAGRPRVGETGHKIAWATAQARTHVERLGFFRGNANLLAAWSLGGEGVWALSIDGDGVHNWDAAILYYPSNQDDLVIAPGFPSLALVGSLDDVTPALQVSDAAASSGFLDVVVFEAAHHGFDIASLETGRTVRLFPVFGPSATFQYNARAAASAVEEIDHFLERHSLPNCAATP